MVSAQGTTVLVEVETLWQHLRTALHRHEDLNDAVRVSADPTFLLLGSKKNTGIEAGR